MDQAIGLPQPPHISSPPAASSFTAPEGSYELLFELNAPTPGNISATAAPGQGAQLPQAPLVPEYPAGLCTAVLYFAGNAQPIGGGGTLLGLGNPQKASKIKDDQYASQHSNINEDVASTTSGSTASAPDGAQVHQNWTSPPANGHTPAASKKKPLVSLPSLAAVPSVLSSASPAPSSANTSKPKSAFRGTTSTFVKMYEGLPLSSKVDRLWGGSEAREVILAVFTTPRAVLIVDISRSKNRENIARIAFSAIPTCIALNYATLSHDRMDILVGFATGDVVWMEVFCGRYTRYNKDAQTAATNPNKPGGAISTAPITKVAWLPGAGQGDNMFCTAHRDGCLVFWDKDREDPVIFTPNHGLAPPANPLPQNSVPIEALSKTDSIDSQDTGRYSNGDRVPASGSRSRFGRGQQVEEYTDDIVVTLPQLSNAKNANRYNPAAHWKVSRKAITDFSVSPDSQYVAVVSEDGCLRIIDANSQRLLDTFQAYFGGLTCVTWSPDGRFLLTGGQDDLACVWSPFEQRIVARCEGHSSFLTGLSFDAWRCDNRAQRFASVSEDCRLIFWDLSSAALQRPKGHLHQLHHSHGHFGKDQVLYSRRAGATSSLSLSRKRTLDSSLNLPASAAEDREGPLWHTAPNRSEVAGLQPVMSKTISTDLLSGVVFLSDLVVTISRSAIVRVFARPDSRL